jgi:hypothetical protein
MLPQRILIFTVGNTIYPENSSLQTRFGSHDAKELAKPQFQIPNIYF